MEFGAGRMVPGPGIQYKMKNPLTPVDTGQIGGVEQQTSAAGPHRYRGVVRAGHDTSALRGRERDKGRGREGRKLPSASRTRRPQINLAAL